MMTKTNVCISQDLIIKNMYYNTASKMLVISNVIIHILCRVFNIHTMHIIITIILFLIIVITLIKYILQIFTKNKNTILNILSLIFLCFCTLILLYSGITDIVFQYYPKIIESNLYMNIATFISTVFFAINFFVGLKNYNYLNITTKPLNNNVKNCIKKRKIAKTPLGSPLQYQEWVNPHARQTRR